MRPLSDDSLKSLARATSLYEQDADRVMAYLGRRGISPSTAASFRLGFVSTPIEGHEQMRGRLAIPSLGPRGAVSLRFRCVEPHDCKEAGHGKYLGVPGAETRIFNTRALHEAGDYIAIAEGELDAVILNQCGIPAVAVPGARNWKPHYNRVFAGFSNVYVAEDGDEAGREFARKVAGEVLTASVITMGTGQDVTDVFLAEGQSGVRARFGLNVEGRSGDD